MLCSAVDGGRRAYRTALALGAERVLALPARRRLADRAAHRRGRRRPGAGPAGRGRRAARAARAPRRSRAPSARSRPGTAPPSSSTSTRSGPGVDRVLGLDSTDGVRWSDLASTTGRLGARSLREALPRQDRLAALTWSGRAAPPPCRPTSCATACPPPAAGTTWSWSTSREGPDPLVAELVARCDLVVVVVSPTRLRCRVDLGPGGPVRRARALGARGARPRSRPRGGRRVTGLPLLAEMADQRRLAESVDLGLGPVRSRRGPLARAAAQVLAQVAA